MSSHIPTSAPYTTATSTSQYPGGMKVEDDTYHFSTTPFLIACIVALVTGFTGIQRFYIRRNGSAFAQLLLGPPGWFILSVFFCGTLFFIPWFIIGYIWCIYDLIKSQSLVEKANVKYGGGVPIRY